MAARSAVWIVLIAAIAFAAVVLGPLVLGPSAPSPPPGATGLLGVPAQTAAPRATPAATSPLPAASPTPTPARTPTTSCPPVPAGGREGGFHALSDVRVAHQPGADRVVFDFGQEASAQDELPAFGIERASSFTNVAGQPVRVEGSAFWSVRFDGASMQREGRLVYQGPRDFDPTTPLVRDLKLVEDFEAVMTWAIGLERLECPRVTTLRSPLRLVIDYPTPP